MPKTTKNSFSLTLFNIYKREKKTTRLPFFQLEKEGDKAVQSAFHRLYPLAEKIFTAENVFRTVRSDLLKDLKQVWRVGKHHLPIRFVRAGAFLLEKEYLLLYLEVIPDMAETGNDDLVEAAVSITDNLSGRLNKSFLIRAFKNEQQKDLARNRFHGNDNLPLIPAILNLATCCYF